MPTTNPDDDLEFERRTAETLETGKNRGFFRRASKAASATKRNVDDAIVSGGRTYKATVEGGEKLLHAVTPAAKGAAKFTIWGAPHVWHGITWSTDKMWRKKGPDGIKHVDIGYGLRNMAIAGFAGLMTFFAAGEAVNWMTVRDYDNVFVTNATHTQQFVEPSKAGTLNTATDEIFTVVGQYKEPHTVKDPKTGTESIVYGQAEPIRFDIDENTWTGVFRPDFVFSQIPNNNAICSFRANGIFTWVPRFARVGVLKFMNFKPHILEVKHCSSLMDQLAHPNALGPWSSSELRADPSPQP